MRLQWMNTTHQPAGTGTHLHCTFVTVALSCTQLFLLTHTLLVMALLQLWESIVVGSAYRNTLGHCLVEHSCWGAFLLACTAQHHLQQQTGLKAALLQGGVC